jgi:hypothetical protein
VAGVGVDVAGVVGDKDLQEEGSVALRWFDSRLVRSSMSEWVRQNQKRMWSKP